MEYVCNRSLHRGKRGRVQQIITTVGILRWANGNRPGVDESSERIATGRGETEVRSTARRFLECHDFRRRRHRQRWPWSVAADGSQNVEAQLDQCGDIRVQHFRREARDRDAVGELRFQSPRRCVEHAPAPSESRAELPLLDRRLAGPGPIRVPLQYLGTSGYPTSQCGYMGNAFAATSTTNYRVSFHKGYEDTSASPTAFVVFNSREARVRLCGPCSRRGGMLAELERRRATVRRRRYSVRVLLDPVPVHARRQLASRRGWRCLPATPSCCLHLTGQ